MKRIIFITLAILLTACLSPSGGAPQTAEPTPTATLTPMLTATEALSPTPTPPDPDLEYIENFLAT
jgi:hypothetical protein